MSCDRRRHEPAVWHEPAPDGGERDADRPRPAAVADGARGAVVHQHPRRRRGVAARAGGRGRARSARRGVLQTRLTGRRRDRGTPRRGHGPHVSGGPGHDRGADRRVRAGAGRRSQELLRRLRRGVRARSTRSWPTCCGGWCPTASSHPVSSRRPGDVPDRAARLRDLDRVAFVSDGALPFADNVEEAGRHGVRYIAEPGDSIRSTAVAEACERLGITLVPGPVSACSGTDRVSSAWTARLPAARSVNRALLDAHRVARRVAERRVAGPPRPVDRLLQHPRRPWPGPARTSCRGRRC